MERVFNNAPYITTITWNITSKCNFSCSYCPTELHDGKFGFPNYNNALHFIKEVAKSTDHVFLELSGGEVTLWPKLIDFLQEVQNYLNVTTMILTNGSRTNAWWEKYANSKLQLKTLFVFSFHHEQCDPDLYYSNLEIISKKYNVVAMLLVDPNKYKSITSLGKKIQDNLPVDVIYKPIRDNLHQTKLIDGYTDEMLEFLKQNFNTNEYDRSRFPVKDADKIIWPTQIQIDGIPQNWQEVIINKQHSFKGWKCTAGTTRIFINVDGTVYTCSEGRYFSQTKSKFILGNINKRDVKLLNDYVTCPADFCPCKIDAMAPKYKHI